MSSFQVPTCCSCQIDGYREKFPPVGSHGIDDQELFETRFSASDALYSLANNDYNDNDNDNDNDDLSSESSSSIYQPPAVHQKKRIRTDKRKKIKRPPPQSSPVSNLDSYLTPPNRNRFLETDSFKRKQSIGTSSNRSPERKNSQQQPVLIGNDDTADLNPSIATVSERPKNGFSAINLPAKHNQQQQQQIPRLSPSKVLIKRVNYNYHPIIDFFFRDRAVKAQKAKERTGHTSIVS